MWAVPMSCSVLPHIYQPWSCSIQIFPAVAGHGFPDSFLVLKRSGNVTIFSPKCSPSTVCAHVSADFPQQLVVASLTASLCQKGLTMLRFSPRCCPSVVCAHVSAEFPQQLVVASLTAFLFQKALTMMLHVLRPGAVQVWSVPMYLRPLAAGLGSSVAHLLGDVPSPPLVAWLQSTPFITPGQAFMHDHAAGSRCISRDAC